MRERWNERHSADRFVWSDEPNRLLIHALDGLEAGARVLDLACGQGQNAVWLAERGFQVTAIDFSGRAIRRALELATERNVGVEWICGDVTRFVPPREAFRLALILYLHVSSRKRRTVLDCAAQALAPGGELLMIGHAGRNLAEGAREPCDPDVLFDPTEIAGELESAGFEVERSEYVRRPLADRGGAVDVILRARRRPG